MTFPMPFIVPANRPLLPVEIAYAGENERSVSGTSISVTGVPFGAVDHKKDAFLAVHWRPWSGSVWSRMTSVTVNGVPGTILEQEVQAYNSGYNGCGVGLVRVPAPSVTSGSVSIDFDDGIYAARVATFRVANASPTPVQMKKARRGGSLGDLSVSLNVPEGGGAIALMTQTSTGGFAAPVSQDYAISGATVERNVGGSYETEVGNSNLQVQTTSGGTMFTGVICAYALR